MYITVEFHYGWLAPFNIINFVETKVLKVINKKNNSNNNSSRTSAAVPSYILQVQQ